MLNKFAAIVLFAQEPQLDAGRLQQDLNSLEAAQPARVTPVDGGLEVRSGGSTAMVTTHRGPMSEEHAIASIGMADLVEEDAQRLLAHGGYMQMETADAGEPMERMILLLKLGIALSRTGGWALCVPSSGLCIQARDLEHLDRQNQLGPRVWGLDDAEGALPAYEPRDLWESLRREAQPSNLLAGFVPAQVENHTWFFSAGHSLFGLPELVYSDGTLEDFHTVRGLFRFLFSYYLLHPEQMKAGKTVRTADDALIVSLHALPARYQELQATTGTLRVRLASTSEVDSEWDK